MADDETTPAAPDEEPRPADDTGADPHSTGSTGPGSAAGPGGAAGSGAGRGEQPRLGPTPAQPDPTQGGPTQPGPTSGGGPANPFEALFGSLGLGQPGGVAGFGMPVGQPGQPSQFGQPGQPGQFDMNQMMTQLQQAFSMLSSGGFGGVQGSDSGVNWEITKDTARKTVASLGPDPTPDSRQRAELADAVELAEVWLDEATALPRATTRAVAWSRAEWVEQTMPVWQRLVEPVATHIADAMEGALSFSDGEGGVPDELSALGGLAGMEQMLRPMLRTSGASMFGLQLGQGLGRLATEVVGATEIGLPLSSSSDVALLPTNIAAFAEGLEESSRDITPYLALRECARTRLFDAAPWLREQMLVLVEEYARGITIDTSALEQAVGEMDPNNFAELSEKLQGGLFEPQKTPEQQATLARLETMLALVEGWVDEVVGQATTRWMPAAAALAETVRRRRATGGPAEATFATLVGLELRPRRMRDAANLWAAVRADRGIDGRDAVWSHPDLIPTTADLDDPLGFVSKDRSAQSDTDFDDALAELLDSAADGEPGPQDDEPGPDAR